MGDTYKTVGDKVTLRLYRRCEVSISPLSFYQVNPVQTKVLYDKALEYANLSGMKTYGSVFVSETIPVLAKKAKNVYGVEIVHRQSRTQRIMRRLIHQECQVLVGKQKKYFRRIRGARCEADVIVVDPPRKGV